MLYEKLGLARFPALPRITVPPEDVDRPIKHRLETQDADANDLRDIGGRDACLRDTLAVAGSSPGMGSAGGVIRAVSSPLLYCFLTKFPGIAGPE